MEMWISYDNWHDVSAFTYFMNEQYAITYEQLKKNILTEYWMNIWVGIFQLAHNQYIFQFNISSAFLFDLLKMIMYFEMQFIF